MFKVKFTGKFIAYTAILTALCALANIYSIPISGSSSNFLSFTYIPCFLAGIYLGVPAAFFVGAIGDVLGCLIAPKGAWLPLIILASSLIGVIPGILFYLFNKKNNENKRPILKRNILLWISLVFVLIICTSGINTLTLWMTYSKGKTFWVYLGARLPTQLFVLLINGILLSILTSTPIIHKALTLQSINK
ncbi:MAG: folate family ECF transporter S component [Clostridia bacterium]